MVENENIKGVMGKRADKNVRMRRFMSSRVKIIIAFSWALFIAPAASTGGPVQERVEWNDVLYQETEWYSSGEAVRIAENVLTYQHENGGWPKNIDMAQVLGKADLERIEHDRAEAGTEISRSTIDNGATFTQVRYLARVFGVTGDERYKEGVYRGVDYLLDAQYSSGGWPQYYPLREGYYENITFNDGAMIGTISLLRDVAEGTDPFSFVDSSRRQRANEAVGKGIEVILETQIIQNSEQTVWCAQHDPQTLRPAWARAYEPPSLSGSESVGVVYFLMSIKEPGPEIIAAIEGAVAWFRSVVIHGYRYEGFTDATGRSDRRVVDDPNAGPLWARFYQLGTNRPIFLGRDSVVRYALAEIEQERRSGYSYYGGWAAELLAEDYPLWRSRNNLPME